MAGAIDTPPHNTTVPEAVPPYATGAVAPLTHALSQQLSGMPADPMPMACEPVVEYSASNMYPMPAPGQMSAARMRALNRNVSMSQSRAGRRSVGSDGGGSAQQVNVSLHAPHSPGSNQQVRLLRRRNCCLFLFRGGGVPELDSGHFDPHGSSNTSAAFELVDRFTVCELRQCGSAEQRHMSGALRWGIRQASTGTAWQFPRG